MPQMGREEGIGPPLPDVRAARMTRDPTETRATPGPPAVAPDSNAAQPWDYFDSSWYLAHNYQSLRLDDREILQRIANFFARAGGAFRQGIDVGTGTNLYPALAMLPFCQEIKLVEWSRPNVTWLRRQLVGYAPTWDPFWSALVEAQREQYECLDPRSALKSAAEVRQGSIFALPAGRWDLGTMLFVAESITGQREEFERAIGRFVRSLRPDAPLAAAFMRHSSGYLVNRLRFPGVDIDEQDIDVCLAAVAYDVAVTRIPIVGNPLRDGYDGMILATGYAKGT